MPVVKQHSIAKRLNLSIATVSRSLANHPAISEETRERVQRAADELGYKPRSGARSTPNFAGRRSIRIGVLVGLQPNSSPLATFPLILKGIQERAQIEGALTDVSYIDPNQLSNSPRTNPIL